ncbi:Uncharacterized protein C31H12.03c [Choanephora cucurbitarum]|uniref:Uncharacterized protein C31H12.03c n=1 Tax=Choanephora cucurbitarum TaxID=101091 RepID=A0A1C7NA92_9FUNG|nr:Uncharacterized protein C31H12.03c [Choanephora cucurbitarum]
MSADKYKNLKVKDLQDLLQKNGLPHSGKKEELIERLVKHDEQNQEFASLEEEFGDLDEFDESKVNLDELGDKPIDDLTSFDDNLESHTETKKKEEEKTVSEEESKEKSKEESKEETKPNSNFKFTPITFDKPADTKKEENSAKALSDAERALERAKRFGIQLNESAKKDIRAQRFGIADKQAKPTTGADPDVLKKRAERFGISTSQANIAKGKVPVKLDAAEEEKKRKRAERFNANKKQKAE